MASEKNFEKKVKSFLKNRNCWILKTWSNGVQRSGVPDLLINCNGYFVGIELKAPRGKPSELQLYNVRKIRESGGIAIVLYPDKFELFTHVIDLLLLNDFKFVFTNQYMFDREGWFE